MVLEVVVEVVTALEVVEMEGRVVEGEVRELDIAVEVDVEGDDSVAMATMNAKTSQDGSVVTGANGLKKYPTLELVWQNSP